MPQKLEIIKSWIKNSVDATKSKKKIITDRILHLEDRGPFMIIINMGGKDGNMTNDLILIIIGKKIKHFRIISKLVSYFIHHLLIFTIIYCGIIYSCFIFISAVDFIFICEIKRRPRMINPGTANAFIIFIKNCVLTWSNRP